MWRYARGEAFARKGDAQGVLAEARDMAPSAAELSPWPRPTRTGSSSPSPARCWKAGRPCCRGAGIGPPRPTPLAASLQEAKFADSWDPPAWWFPVRRSLAEAELRAGRIDQAEADARTVLKSWSDDPLTERVLAEVDQARGRDGAAWLDKAKLRWKGDLAAIRPAEL